MLNGEKAVILECGDKDEKIDCELKVLRCHTKEFSFITSRLKVIHSIY